MGRPLSPTSRAYAYAYLVERDGETCTICEKSPPATPLEIDHIDGDKANPAPSNLRFLCKPCNIAARNHALGSYASRGLGNPKGN
jgi:5-methylcytosine-specific restriction endonuclease McrA